MFGCTNNRSGGNQCTIILIIIIFALQGLLNGSNQSKTALILLFLYWLCAGGCGNNAPVQNVNCGMTPCTVPMNNCCLPQSRCCCKSRKHRKDSCTCKCNRVKVCYNTGRCCGQ